MSSAQWLASPFRYSEGWVDYIDVAQPAAGANASVPVPGQYGMIVLAARATLTTDANVANRLLSLDYITPNSTTRVRNAPSRVWAANTTGQSFVWNRAWNVDSFNANGPVLVPVLDLLLPPTWTIQFTVDNKQVGDQLSGLSLVVWKIPTGASAIDE